MTTAKWSLRALIIAAVGFVGVLIWFALALPDQVPGHFNAAGEVDRYNSKRAFVALMAGLGAVLTGLFLSARWWMPKLPPSMINLPKRKKAYWMRPENRDELNKIMAGANEAFGALVLSVLSVVILLSGLSGLGVDVPGWAFWVSFAAFLGAMVLVLIPVFRKTRVPDERRPARGRVPNQ